MSLEEFVKGNDHVHPNRISAYGLALTAGAIITSAFDETKFLAPVIYAFGAGCDYMDGRVARTYGLGTKIGAMLDPMIDKAKNLLVGGLMIYNEGIASPMLAVANVANFAVDYVSQRSRGPIVSQMAECARGVLDPQSCPKDTETVSRVRANGFGKWKTAIQNLCHLGYLTYLSCHDTFVQSFGGEIREESLTAISSALIAGAVLGTIGIAKRQRQKI